MNSPTAEKILVDRGLFQKDFGKRRSSLPPVPASKARILLNEISSDGLLKTMRTRNKSLIIRSKLKEGKNPLLMTSPPSPCRWQAKSTLETLRLPAIGKPTHDEFGNTYHT